MIFSLTIPENNVSNFYKEFEKYIKMCVSMDLSSPSFEEISREQKTVKIYDIIEGVNGVKETKIINKYLIDVVNIRVDIEESIKFNGWSLFATIHYRENVIDLVDVESKLPEIYNLNNTKCEHCNHNHSNRVTSFIVKNEMNEYKQVGSTCIDQFMGISPSKLLKLNAQLMIILKAFNEYNLDGDSFIKDTSFLQNRKAYDIKEMYSVCLNILKTNDFRYIKKEYDEVDWSRQINIGESTSEQISKIINSDDYKAENISDEYFENVNEFLTNMKVENEFDCNGEDSFETKVKNIKDSTMIRFIDIWCVVWAIILYNQSIELKKKENVHIGVVGQKSNIECTIIDFKTGSSFYGDWKLYIMEDKFGNSINKFGEIGINYLIKAENNEDVCCAEIGDKVNASAMIKSHDIKKDRNITMLGRLSKIKKVKSK